MSEIITNKLTGKTSAGNVTITSEGGSATMKLQDGVAKVRCKSNQRNAVYTVIDSFNTSSITDESGVGQSTMAFTNSFADINFSYVGSCGDEGVSASNNGAVLRLEDNAQTTGTSGNVETLSMSTDISVDTPRVNYLAFGDLA
jgi:hypothetical protein